MELEESVRFIVKTYDLSPKLRQKIRGIAVRRFRRAYIYDFDEQYAQIADLVDRYTQRQAKLFHAGVFPQHAISYENAWPRNGEIDANEAQSQRDQSLRILRPLVKSAEYEFLCRLCNCSSHVVPRADQVQSEAQRIRQRLEQLAERFQVGNRIIFPSRPIKKLTFDPFRVVFERRSFSNDALERYRSYAAIYGQLGRKELYQVDPSLYMALRYSQQLDQAIPQRYARRNREWDR